MGFASSLSTHSDPERAAAAASDELRNQLAGVPPDLVCMFVTPRTAVEPERLLAAVQRRVKPRHLIGCTAESVLGVCREIEERPALSLWAAVLPAADVTPFHVTFEKAPDGLVSDGFPRPVRGDGERKLVLFLGDPFSCHVPAVLEQIADEFPRVPLVGGMASGARGPGMNRLFLDDEVLRTGGVGVVIEGGPPFHTVVSQGCRPIGTPFVVTRGERCVIWELGGEPPLTRLQELFPTLDERDQKLVQRGLHVGIVMNEYQEKFRSGDFLISNVAGIDESIGAMVIAGGIRTGQTVQFHVRDAVTADEELRAMLRAVAAGSPGARIGGGLVFSCNGRGTKLFEEPHHDAQAVADQFGRVPLAGFFAMGELGPVGPRSYIHGFTASIALFETDGT